MKEKRYPKIYLVADNCFAVKRWVRPDDWMRAVNEIGGITCIQASTDNEIDPTHNTQAFRDEWVSEVQRGEKKYGQKVVSFYSGYAEYRTVGIASHREDKRRAMIERYFEPIVDVAQKLGAQVGNTLSAYSDPVLQDPALFAQTERRVEESLAQMSEYAVGKNVLFGYEQMYSPTQGMWTIDGCAQSMRAVRKRAGAPMYVTIDTAHQAGQRYFQKPTQQEMEAMREAGSTDGRHLPQEISAYILNDRSWSGIDALMERYGYWFAQPEDGDVYAWISKLGCYSPIMHLQQTDGTYSAHKPFVAEYNEKGIIHPKEVLRAIKQAYDAPEEEGMPERASEIYLAFELFYGVTHTTKAIIRDMRESVLYWREVIPKDGVYLDELINDECL